MSSWMQLLVFNICLIHYDKRMLHKHKKYKTHSLIYFQIKKKLLINSKILINILYNYIYIGWMLKCEFHLSLYLIWWNLFLCFLYHIFIIFLNMHLLLIISCIQYFLFYFTAINMDNSYVYLLSMTSHCKNNTCVTYNK